MLQPATRVAGTEPLIFPLANSSFLPNPSKFFSPELLASPLPTNSFFQNFVLNSKEPEYIHPYLIKLSPSSLTLCYPSRITTSSSIHQVFKSDITISGSGDPNHGSKNHHIVSAFSDLSVTVDFPSWDLRFFLVRGSPFLTSSVLKYRSLKLTTAHGIESISCASCRTKYTIKLGNNQVWLVYTCSPINLFLHESSIKTNGFTGIIRIAVLPATGYESILDQYRSCYPISGEAVFSRPFSLEYQWEKSEESGHLLMLAHPLHLQLLNTSDDDDDCVTVLNDFRYKSIDGDLVGIVGDKWELKTETVSVSWYSISSIKEEFYEDIVSALFKDVGDLVSYTISETSVLVYGKRIARAARLSVIAEEVGFLHVIPVVKKFLKESIEPWLDGSFKNNAFLYDGSWGGLVSKQGCSSSTADCRFGMYSNRHHHLGYFLYAIAVLVRIDPAWGRKYRPQVYALMEDIMNQVQNPNYTRLRCFDFYKLHSWGGGFPSSNDDSPDGRTQESVSEAVNAYYSAALLGLAYGDAHLALLGKTLAAFEIQAAKTWWHISTTTTIYKEEVKFRQANKVVGILWSNKRESRLWCGQPDHKEYRLGIQVLPVLPITKVLFSDIGFVQELVKWAYPSLKRDGASRSWKGFAYALEGMFDKKTALKNIKKMKEFEEGSSLSNLIWWVHSCGK